jgi:hypothetical protein
LPSTSSILDTLPSARFLPHQGQMFGNVLKASWCLADFLYYPPTSWNFSPVLRFCVISLRIEE